MVITHFRFAGEDQSSATLDVNECSSRGNVAFTSYPSNPVMTTSLPSEEQSNSNMNACTDKTNHTNSNIGFPKEIDMQPLVLDAEVASSPNNITGTCDEQELSLITDTLTCLVEQRSTSDGLDFLPYSSLAKMNKANICNKLAKKYENNCIEDKQMVLTESKFYECNVCCKQFIRRDHLYRHMNTHTKENVMKCAVCNKQFLKEYNLRQHMRVHTGQGDFQCDICRKQFTRLSSLKTHKNIHTKERLFQCNLCNKEFTQLIGLQRHMNVHTKNKSHECDVCRKKLSRKDHLKRHIKAVHTAAELQCTLT